MCNYAFFFLRAPSSLKGDRRGSGHAALLGRCVMAYLIDGYNLLHAMGGLRQRAGPGGLEKARLRLLGHLRGGHGYAPGAITVVFDAAGVPAAGVDVQDYQGIRVYYAHEQQADDLIEDLIARDSAPRQLTVVSDDHRIQQAARRRHCTVLGCDAYLDWLDRHRRQRQRRPPPQAGKPEGISSAETAHWLQEFAELENDPSWKKLVDPSEFFDFPDRNQ